MKDGSDLDEMEGFGPFDHAKVDRTAEKRSPYRIGEGQGDIRLYICDFAICDSNIASGVTLRHAIEKSHQGIASRMTRDESLNSCDDAIAKYECDKR